MILEIKKDSITIVSQDVVDAEYLIDLFSGPIEYTIDRDPVCVGFCITDERDVQITFTKEEL